MYDRGQPAGKSEDQHNPSDKNKGGRMMVRNKGERERGTDVITNVSDPPRRKNERGPIATW